MQVELLRLFVTIGFNLQKINEDKLNHSDEYCNRKSIHGSYISNSDHVPLSPPPPPPSPTASDFLRAIFCKSHPTCDSRVFRISSYFNQQKIKVTLEYGRNFGFIKHFVEFLGGSRDNSSFSRNAVSVPKLYFESHLTLLELLFRVQVTCT